MPIFIIIAVLGAALMHATWNSMIKGGKDPLLDSMVLSASLMVICAGLLLFLPLPHPDSYLYVLGSAFIHLIYFFLLAKSYEIADLSVVYPLIRGLPPLLVVAFSLLFLNENISPFGVAGVVLAGSGVMIMGWKSNKDIAPKALFLALLTALMIASYVILMRLGYG